MSSRKVLLYSDQSVLDQKSLTQEELSECFREFQEVARESGTVSVEWE